MIANIRMWIVIVALGGTACVSAGIIYGPRLARSVMPQFFVARAVTTTADEFLPSLQAVNAILPEIISNALRHEFTLRINRLEGDLAANIDQNIISALPLTSLRSVTRWSEYRDVFTADLNLQIAATSLFHTDFYFDQERIAVNIPLLFDYALYLDPSRLGTDWNGSVFGTFLPALPVDDIEFFQTYSLMFERVMPEHIDFTEFLDTLPGLIPYMEFEYLARVTLGDEEVDSFRVTIPVEQANISWRILWSNFPELDIMDLSEDLAFNAYVDGDRLAQLSFSPIFSNGNISSNIDGNIRFTDEGAAQFNIVSDQGPTIVGGRIALSQNDINFDIELNQETFNLATSGAIRLFPDAWRIEADFNNISLAIPEANITANLNYMLLPDREPIIFDADSARHLTDLNIFDLLGLIGRVEGTPLGEIISNFLPF